MKNEYFIVDGIINMKVSYKENNYICLIDEVDLEKLSLLNVKWRVKIRNGRIECVYGNKKINGKTKVYYIHRVILNPPKEMFVDHIDRNPLNNQRNNLRICTIKENNCNRNKVRSKNNQIPTSRFKGVWKSKNNFGLKINKKSITFTNEIAAANYYNHFALKEFGEFASLNDVEYMSIEECEKYMLKNVPRGTSKYKGVYFSDNYWVARFYDQTRKIKIYLGCFENEELAYQAIINYLNKKEEIK